MTADLAEPRMLDRIARICRKNAAALGQENKVEAVLLVDGSMVVRWRAGVDLTPEEAACEPHVYPSVAAAYDAALHSHLNALRVRYRMKLDRELGVA